MGASGKKLQGHGARNKGKSPPAQSKDGGYGLPPHPLVARPGQRYVPRAGAVKRPIRVGGVDQRAGKVIAYRLEGERERVTISMARLLAVRADGQGRYFQLQGFDSRRYKTYAVVAGVRDDGQAELVLPEWHPGRPLRHPARLLPAAATSGTWLRCTADLSRGRPAWLNIADIEVCADPGPAVCHRPTFIFSRPAMPPPRPATGEGCGDIVLDLPVGVFDTYMTVAGLLEIPVAGRVAEVQPGDRVYLAEEGWISRYVRVSERRMLPSVDRLCCDPQAIALAEPIIADGSIMQHRWRWRWWNRELERAPRGWLGRTTDSHAR